MRRNEYQFLWYRAFQKEWKSESRSYEDIVIRLNKSVDGSINAYIRLQ